MNWYTATHNFMGALCRTPVPPSYQRSVGGCSVVYRFLYRGNFGARIGDWRIENAEAEVVRFCNSKH